MATIVLVHGAWHGSWCWQRVAPLLEKRGLAVRTVDLPSVGARPGAGTDLSADAAALEAVIESVAGPVILCGHSYGGMVISRAHARQVHRSTASPRFSSSGATRCQHQLPCQAPCTRTIVAMKAMIH